MIMCLYTNLCIYGFFSLSFAEKDGYEVKVASNKAVMSQLVSFLGCSQQNDNFFHASAMGGILNLAFRLVNFFLKRVHCCQCT